MSQPAWKAELRADLDQNAWKIILYGLWDTDEAMAVVMPHIEAAFKRGHDAAKLRLADEAQQPTAGEPPRLPPMDPVHILGIEASDGAGEQPVPLRGELSLAAFLSAHEPPVPTSTETVRGDMQRKENARLRAELSKVNGRFEWTAREAAESAQTVERLRRELEQIKKGLT